MLSLILLSPCASLLLRSDLHNNGLSGTIPTEVGLLTYMHKLFLSGNELSGTIPSELGYMTRLWTLDLTGNKLSGTVPTELGTLRQLDVLCAARCRPRTHCYNTARHARLFPPMSD